MSPMMPSKLVIGQFGLMGESLTQLVYFMQIVIYSAGKNLKNQS